MIDDRKILELTEQLYRTAFDGTAWDSVLATLTEQFKGSLATLMSQDPNSGQINSHGVHNLDDAAIKAYGEHYAAISTLVPHAQKFGVGEIFTEQMVADKREYLNSAAYNEYFRPKGADHLVQTLLAKDASDVTTILVRRDARSGPFDREERADFQRLFPHLQQANRVCQALAKANQKNATLTDTIDCLKMGVLLVNSLGRVVYYNRATQDILNDNDGFAIDRDGKCVSALRDETRDLRRLIDRTCRQDKQEEINSGGALRLSRPSFRRSYTLLIAPVFQTAASDDSHPAVVVFLGDPEKAHDLSPQVISRHFGLTAAEAKLVAGLVEGISLRDVADKIDITENTARYVLKNIFAKTATARQSDLVSLVLSSPAVNKAQNTD